MSKRRIVLIRHCRPNLPDNEHRCLGKADIPLGPFGRMQAVLLAEELHFETVYSSPLKRAMETAAFIGDHVAAVPDFIEASSGPWDGLTYREIEAGWPDFCKIRGLTDSCFPLEGAETNESCWRRFEKAFAELTEKEPGDIAVVAHSTILWQRIGGLMGCGEYFENGQIHRPAPRLTAGLEEKLILASGLDEDAAKRLIPLLDLKP